MRNPYSSASISSSRRQPDGPVSATKTKSLDRTRTAPEVINSSTSTPYSSQNAIPTSPLYSQSPLPNSRVNVVCVLSNSTAKSDTTELTPRSPTAPEVTTTDLQTLSASALNWTAEKVDGKSAVKTAYSQNGKHLSMPPTIEMERLNDEPSASSTEASSQKRSSNGRDGAGGAAASDAARNRSCFSWCPFGSRGRNSGDRPRSGTNAPLENRIVHVTGTHRAFLDNSITTAKYNILSFLPKFLFEQFRRYSNIFFLFIALMQQIPNVSPTGRFTTAVPLIVIMFVSAIKEMFEDVKRHRADNQVNTTEAEVVNRFTGSVVKTKWKDISVGDIVVMKQDQFFPSDLVLISSHEPSGLCYIETSNLDGETNLKARSSLQVTDPICSRQLPNAKKEIDYVATCGSALMTATIECDAPNKMLYEFCGKLKINSDEHPIGPENILLRGAKMRNTEWALGVAIYTGHETKLMMNSMAQAPLKQSHVEISTNRQILALLGILIVICLISAGASAWWMHVNPNHWYLSELQSDASANFFLTLLTFIILYNNLIPISLQVTLEMVRFIQAHFINCDLEMYCEETDTPAMARTSNLNEELGQVRYILSDKTGTLTRNVMEFKKCSINGRIFDEKKFYRLIEMIRKKEEDWQKVREFLVLLSVCHTVIPEPSKNAENGSRFVYTASSPDEAALVKGAQKIGFEFLQRTPRHVLIDAMGSTEKYEILNVLEFNSDRKRMSVVARTPAGKLKLYIKGADSIIQKRLTAESQLEFDAIEVALTTFATDGLRTLCVAYADLTEEAYSDWERRYKQALLMSKNGTATDANGRTREEAINELMSEIESNLSLLGVTAIEDKLQVGVPDTIETLMLAGINVWMLTGDKQETAINIGYSCRLLKNTQALDSYHIINDDTMDLVRESIAQGDVKIRAHPEDFTLIIDNKSLGFALKPQLQSSFMDVALKCRSVICCRVSPAQKAEIVNAVKRSTKSITLAIGDGANDVAMIRAANVGVGISGREGLQAVYSSDYSIAQFRFLARLLLVHGSWSLSRVCKLILYSFYKNIALYVIELWFATISAWSGQAIFERWSLSFYNVLFTAAPPLVIGLFDRVCSAEIMLNNPKLYSEQWNTFSIKLFWLWVASAIWHSLVLFWGTYFSFSHDALWANGKADGGYLCFGNILYTYVVVTVCLKAALETSCWTIITHAAIWGSIAVWFIFVVIYSRLWPTIPFGAEMASIDTIIFSTWLFWLGMAVIPFSALLVDIVAKLVQRTCFKTLADQITEFELAKSYQQPSFGERARLVLNHILPGHRRNDAGTTPIHTSTGAGPSELSDTPDIEIAPESASSDDFQPQPDNAELLRSDFKQMRFGSSDAEIDAKHGYSFSQEESNPEDLDRPLSQSNLIRQYNTRM